MVHEFVGMEQLGNLGPKMELLKVANHAKFGPLAVWSLNGPTHFVDNFNWSNTCVWAMDTCAMHVGA